MAGTGKTSKLPQVAAAEPANLFITGATLRDSGHAATWEPSAINVISHGRHAFSNQGGADGVVPVATTVKIYETSLEVKRTLGMRCIIQLINVSAGVIHHSFDSGNRMAGGGDWWHWVHDPPIEFNVPANHLLLTRLWIDDTFHRLAVLHIGTRS